MVNSGGDLSLASSTYSLNDLILKSGSTASMTVVSLSAIFEINAGANLGTSSHPTVTGNDFSNVPATTASSPAATPPARSSWVAITGAQPFRRRSRRKSTITATRTIRRSILPRISATPPASRPAQPRLTFNSTSSQQIQLTATVTTSPTSEVIDAGTITFTVFYGTEQIGSSTTPKEVSNGSASATYTLPPDEPVGDYTIDAYYSGYYSSSSNVSYLPASDTSHYLTVTPASTSTSVTSAAATFNAASDQSIPLTATVSSAGGTIGEGQVTFTVLQNGTPVGSSVVGTVNNNQANATYDLLATTPGGEYTIQAVFTDPLDFKTSTGTNTLTVPPPRPRSRLPTRPRALAPSPAKASPSPPT